MTYDVPKSLLEPPSPLMEFNQIATCHLDRAIHRLPRSSPYRPDLEGMGEELRGKGAGHRPSSLHEELLQFIIDEWAQIPKESSPPPAEGSRLVVEETARLLRDHTHTEACLAFACEVGGVEESIRGVVGRISNLRVPREPDLEKVHNGIDHCESMLSQLKKLQASLNSWNEESLVVLASLSSSSSLPPSPPPPSIRITQTIEIWLFDLSTLLQSANLQLSTKLRELRERETLTNSLHRHLQTLSHTLSAACKLVGDRDDVIEVRGHIQQCKEMHKQLSNKSDWVDQLMDEMEKYVSASPQSHACQNLLDEVKQIKEDWEKVCGELAVVPQLEPTLRVNMLRNVATVIKTMESDLPGLEVTSLKLDDVIAKQKKARSLVSKCRQLLSSLQTTEVNLLQTMSPPAGNQGNAVILPEVVVGGVDPAQQQKRCRELQQDCKRIMSELKTLSSLLATSHTLLERLECETQDLRVWVDDTKAALEVGGVAGTQQHRVKFQAITQQLLAKQPHMESYQSLVSEVLLLPGDTSEKKKIEKEVLALYADWDSICHQCVPAGTLPLMSPTTPQNTLFRAPQEFEDPSQMVEWLIMLDYQLQPEKMVVGDFLHVRRALRDLQLIEAELQSKEKIYNHFMRNIDPSTNTETEAHCNEAGRERSNSPSPPPLSVPLEDSGEFNPQQGVNHVDLSPERRRRQFENWTGMESVQEQSGEEEEEDGSATPHVPEHNDNHSNKSTLLHTATKKTQKTLDNRRQLSMETTSSNPKLSECFPKQPSLPLLLSHTSLPHGLPTPPSSLSSSMQHTPPMSLLSSFSSFDNGSRSLLSRQVSITSSITASLAELLVAGSPGASMPEDLYQLKLLWSGMKTAIEQKRQRLERIRDLWRSFEEKKEEFVGFLARAETRLREFPVTVAQAMDLGLIQNEIETQKSFLEEIPVQERRLSVLNKLGQDLATRYHADDSTADLQDVLQDINRRWTVVMESVARHQPEVNLLSQQWAEFHSHYQSFHQWLRNIDTEMANLNPFVSNMATVQMQLMKLKEIREELAAHEGVLDAVKLLSYKLQGEEGSSCHVNPAAIRSRLESASRRWDHLQKLAHERHAALEESLTDKQQLLTRMADCLSWLQQAEKHMARQKPLGEDYYQIHTQFIAHQTFSQEVEEQMPKMEAVIQAGRSSLLDVHWPLGTPERSRMDSLRSEFLAVEKRWSKVRAESEEWGRILESLHPEMETFQTLCAECGQRLSEVELRANGMPPVANRVVMLTQQLEELREFEAGLVVVGNVLERVIGTQKKLMQLGARVSGDLVELVRRFHERWGEVKKTITKRYSAIDKALVKYDPQNLGVATLPRGWIREKTRNGTPYYIENKRDGGQQWQHPELSQISRSMESEYNQPCYPNMAYPAALKLRNLQKRTQRESFFLFSTTFVSRLLFKNSVSILFIFYSVFTFLHYIHTCHFLHIMLQHQPVFLACPIPNPHVSIPPVHLLET
ncbi:Dystrophin, partial [Geodia barretti]